jgi:hypothetical protein
MGSDLVDTEELCTLQSRTAKFFPVKLVYLFVLFFLSARIAHAQNVTTLPTGKYNAKAKAAQIKWEKGDVLLLDESRYKMSDGAETGDYRFSVAAQRIFFTSGPLKGAYTKVVLLNNKAVIIFPVEQNGELGLTAEVWASK